MQMPPSSRYVTPRPGLCHLNKSKILALYLAESVHPNALDAVIQTGMSFTDTKLRGLATFFRRDVVPRLESAGMKVVFCDLTSATGFEAAVFVQDAIADLTAPANRQTHGDRRVSESRRKSNSIDDAVRTRVAGMTVSSGCWTIQVASHCWRVFRARACLSIRVRERRDISCWFVYRKG